MKKIITIAGSDSGGGAGIQADLKTITVLGAYGMSVITALTAQNTLGVKGVYSVPEDFIRLQMDTVLSDIGADAAKTGMLGTKEIVLTVAKALVAHKIDKLVVDPVMVATSGDPLLDPDAVSVIKKHLIPSAYVVTPNMTEADLLCETSVNDLNDMKNAARKIHDLGPRYVLVKGGHLLNTATDILFDGNTFTEFSTPRIETSHTHGTGCTLSAALATYLAGGLNILEAVEKSKQFITKAIEQSVVIGKGNGPVNPYAHIDTLMALKR